MKTKLRGLVLTAMLLSSTSMTFADQGGSSVGDLPGYDEDAYFDEEAAYAASNHVAHTSHANDSAVRYPAEPAASLSSSPVCTGRHLRTPTRVFCTRLQRVKLSSSKRLSLWLRQYMRRL